MKKPAYFLGILFTTSAIIIHAAVPLSSIESRREARLKHSSIPPKSNRPLQKERRQSPINRAPDEIGPNSKVWTTKQPGSSATGSRLMEIGTGMNYFNGTGWVPSVATFEVTPGSFVANKTQHKVKLSRQLNQRGSVEVISPDGIRLKSTPVGIGFYDAQSGKSAIIASIRDSEGMLLNTNAVLYKDAFNENGVSADVIYTLENASFEQDVIITGRLNPEDYGFPAKTSRMQIFTEFYDPPQPERIRRPIRVEMKDVLRQQMCSPDLIDEVLGFGEFVLATGRAGGALNSDGSSSAPVAKEFKTLNQRTFLIESVELSNIDSELKQLPIAKSALISIPKKRKWSTDVAVIPPARESPVALKTMNNPVLLANNMHEYRKGVVIDYIGTIGGTVNSTTVFQGDMTYFVSSPAIYNGSVVIEGGAVFKFRNSTGTTPSPSTTYLKINGSIVCKSSSYLPAVFTAVDDDSVGEFIFDYEDDQNGNPVQTGYTGHVTEAGPDGIYGNSDDIQKFYGNPFLWVYYINSATLNNLRFSYGQEAIRVERGLDWSITVAHSQFINCIRGIVLTGSASGTGSGTAAPLTLKNALFANVQTPFTANTPTAANLIYHCTIDNSTRIATAATGCTTTFQFVNSVFASVSSAPSGPATLSGNNNGFYNYTPSQFGNTTTRYTSPSNPFQTVGNGSHYLVSASTFRLKGSTSIPSALITELKQRTTQAPSLLESPITISGDMFWGPTAARYVSGQPDLGYWYDPIDYLVSYIYVYNSHLTIAPGTTVGYLLDVSYDYSSLNTTGLYIGNNAILECVGTPTKLNHFISSEVVQELPNNWVPYLAPNGTGLVTIDGWDSPPVVSFRFTDFSVLGSHSLSYKTYHIETGADVFGAFWNAGELAQLSVTDCQFRRGNINFNTDTSEAISSGDYSFQNNLLERVDSSIWWLMPGATVSFYNNLFKGGSTLIDTSLASDTSTWIIKDNLFDTSEINQNGDVLNDFNGYFPNTATRLTPNGFNDKLLTAAPAYQASTLGSYYLPSNTTLYNGGSRSPGDAGLYHYTTRTDQKKDGEETETPNSVNIGLHYVACVGGTPKDTDSDGIPDYIEDANGNGMVDDGETSSVLAQTTTGISDSSNQIYDDTDLDGDGLSGRGEKVWMKNPLVADNPIAFTAINNGLSLNTKILSLPLDLSAITETGHLQMRANGKLMPMVSLQPDINGFVQMTWDTTYDESGLYLIQAEFYINDLWVGSGKISLSDVSTTTPVYSYPLIPGTPEWEYSDVEDRMTSVQIPQEWIDNADDWQLFCSAISNPYFSVLWVPGTSMEDSYNAARTGSVLSILQNVDSSIAIGNNILKFMQSIDLPALSSEQDYAGSGICMMEYDIVCHMAGRNATLNALDQASLLKLFKFAVWDSNYLIAASQNGEAAAPSKLLFATYEHLSPPPSGITIPVLTADQLSALDQGSLPPEIVQTIIDAKRDLNLTYRQ